MKKITLTIFGLLTIALCGILCLSSCDNPLGLGKKVNLVPPAVSIDSPDFMENVGNTFVIEGTAADIEGIALLSITVEHISKDGNAWKQEFRSDHGIWSTQSTDNPVWEDTEKGSWTSLSKESINWSIEISMTEDAPNGEYLISASVENSVQKVSSVQQRRIVKDTSPPVVEILAPILAENTEQFENYELQDPSILNLLHNGEIEIQYEISDDFSLNSLYFQLADKDGNIYYNRDETVVENMGWSGKTTILADEIIDADGNPITEKTYVLLLSTVADRAGNIEQKRSHGWLVWWPDADKPWVDGFGVADKADIQQERVYPGSSVQGQAHDNNSVRSVSYKIYNIDNGENVLVDEDVLTNNPLEEGMPPSAFFNWTLPAPEKCAEYKIVLDCEDSDGNKGETIERYFYVYDVAAPSVSVTSPSAEETLFGDSSGNFIVSGVADDNVDPVSLRMVWLNPTAAANDDSRVLYQSAEYEGWNTIGTDAKGNFVWELELDQKTINPKTERAEKKFSKMLNLFTDLNIGAGTGKYPLTAQSFILRVEGDSGRAVTSLNSVRGDIQPPSLTIEKIVVKPGDGSVEKAYTTEDLRKDEEAAMDYLLEGDEIYLSGTWNDDSAAGWENADHMGAFEARWNGSLVSNAPLKYNGGNNTWEAGPIAYNKEGAGDILITLRDLGNNMVQSSFTARINTFNPVLMSVTSDKSDGAYNAGKEINIYLDFNKEVTYTGTDNPFLTLNNGKTAQRVSGDGTMRHLFTYTVQPGDDVSVLNVDKINFDENSKWTGGGETNMDDIPSGKNLGDTKKIKIDTIAPLISKVESLTGPGYYKAGRTFYLRLTFDETINVTPGGGAHLALADVGNTEDLTQSVSGQNFLLFSYTSEPGDNTANLLVNSLSLNTGATITDDAGNKLTVFDIPIGQNAAAGIVIDTTPPVAPSVSVTDGGGISKIITVSGGENGALVEYSINGAWLPYSAPVTISNSGTYTISARQTDRAGNVSVNTPVPPFTIRPIIPLLSSFGGSGTGTYKTGNTINITLNLREAVTVTGSPTLMLNNGQTAALTSGSGTNRFTFSFTIEDGKDTDEALEITSIDLNGATLRAGNADVTEELPLTGLDGNNKTLSNYTRITIDTTTPMFESAVLTGSTLTLNFSKAISKGSGNITLTHEEGYLAPAILTRDEYSRYGGNSALGSYYTIGTSNTDAEGNPDLTEKYILNFGLNTDDGTVTNALKNQNADKVVVPVVSSAVAIASTTVNGIALTNNALVIELSGTYAFPVKGVAYNLSFGAGLVRDNLQNYVASVADTNNVNIKPSGINPVFIRIKKDKPEIKWNNNIEQFDQYDIDPNNWDIGRIQFYYPDMPLNGNFKIDCQTPTAQLSYTKTLVNSPLNENYTSRPEPPDFDMPDKNVDYSVGNTLRKDTLSEEQYYIIEEQDTRNNPGSPTYFIKLAEVADYTRNVSVPLIPASFVEPSDFGDMKGRGLVQPSGYDGNNNPQWPYVSGTKEYGFVIGIMAQAKGENGETAEPAYEKAARSTIQYNIPLDYSVNPAALTLTFDEREGYITQLWIRGGDRPSGDNFTPGFPLSWNENDRDPSGIELMHIENGHDWYWISWGVNETMYFHFLEGTTPNTDGFADDLNKNGPKDWAWGQAGWAFQHDAYILYPGSSLKFFPTGQGQSGTIGTPNNNPYEWPGFTGHR
jgi:hypothetical protein